MHSTYRKQYITVRSGFAAAKDRLGSVYPTFEEVVQGKKEKISPNIINGSYESQDQYLKTLFWLMREDFVSPLRKGIEEYREWLRSHRTHDSTFESSQVKIHPRVMIGEKRMGKRSCIPMACVPDQRNYSEKDRFKMFLPGSLLCFSNDSFRSLKLATIVFREFRSCETRISLRFWNEPDVPLDETFTMVECEAFFAPYLHVLSALNSTDPKKVPFKKYFVDVIKEDHPPQYLNCYSMPIEVSGVDQQFIFNVTNLDSWPTAAELGLNASQLVALKTALTAELAVIQGPPGTGKTFMALKIAEILLSNKIALKRRTPILVVCMTNHALDQFLVGMLKFTDKLVRVGGQSKCRELDKYNSSNKLGVSLANQDVIGMTTTGAARMKSELDGIGCQVVIVEEAAEVLEAHIIACLSEKLQHLILIGDHKQLRPKVAEYDMEKLNLHISLFERMVINREKCCTLQVQHRMAPEISQLIVPLIYENLQNHESVHHKPQLKSLLKRVSFVTHENLESKVKLSTSKRNQFEAEFLVALCKHLLYQIGYTSEDITILTTYNGQVDLIRQLIRMDKSDKSEVAKALKKVRVAVVDDYQGEESNIILLSLVRSNESGNIGYLAKENRVCVALSRAKNGLVMVGNMDCLSSRSHLWDSIRHTLENQDAISDSLTLRCESHPSHTFKVQDAEDFYTLAPHGGCDQPCVKTPGCGHPCQDICHIVCPEDECPEPCILRYGEEEMHPCTLNCHIVSGKKCEILLPCRVHTIEVENDDELPDMVCQKPCTKLSKKCRKDHICPKLCSEECGLCEVKVGVKQNCGHILLKQCHEDVEDECNERCLKELDCGHECQKKCFESCSPCQACQLDLIVENCNDLTLNRTD
ncbi:NFX1-type zinc finger-containing protein 1-like isoform X2 [Cloeon dipterum]|uniref:NFX1-type zinc finger-containing protein 1-like isoform X2 n=1 Tax=Cloeon dipterum TaxID=197152 RepID=UPI0032204153